MKICPCRQFFQPGDVFILDRGFRDSLVLLENCGYDVHVPLSLEEGETQLSSIAANKTRAVTLCRWVVESVNERKIADDPAKFWDFIKDRKNDRRFVEFYSFRNEEVTGQAAADAFAEYFSSVFQSEVPLLNPLDASLAASIHADATLISVSEFSEFTKIIWRSRWHSGLSCEGLHIHS
ncbi:hypothetical protein HW555_008752 [Spodoptera exigua]|uniref:DDE Tnp4 domain-containing protein n=1 Tax=Spodoptera exigua TaxID=7107 RepID=A0A835GDB7_SPOEX|nr:hypothetical protein HW555_008752 [Spodoptera exigua]